MQCLEIMQWNAQSLMPKISDFDTLLTQEKVHIACVCETWLDAYTSVNISNYNIFRSDRSDSYGGVAIIAHKSVLVQNCSTVLRNVNIEILHCKILNCKLVENIVVIYCPSSIRTTRVDWEELFSKFATKTIILGDFNGHHTNWSYKNDSRGVQLLESALENSFITLNDKSHTRIKLVNGRLQKSSPDVTFISSDVAILFSWKVLSENLGSDHLIIKIKTIYEDQKKYIKKRNFKHADWVGYREHIENNLGLQEISTEVIQLLYDSFIKCLNEAADRFIPNNKICKNIQAKFTPKPYWTPQLSEVVAQRRLALKQFRKNPTPYNLGILEERSKRAKKSIQQAKSNFWKEFCNSIDVATTSSEMWRRMRWVKCQRKSKSIVPVESVNNLILNLTPDSVALPMPKINSRNAMLETKFSLQELEVCLKKKDTSPGADEISFSMMYNLPKNAKLVLLQIYNTVFSSGDIPSQWRKIQIVGIPKASSDFNSAPKIRPISLMTCICKVFHNMIVKRLEWFIENSCVLSPKSYGFRRGHSSVECLTNLVTNIQNSLAENRRTIACFLDIDNAYNNVDITKVIIILDKLGVGVKICKYIWNFLRERHLFNKNEFGEEQATVRVANKGLAQGDPLSPLIFNIVTHKICQEIQNVNILQYADDFVIFDAQRYIQDTANQIQSAINRFGNLLENLGLEISPVKSKIIIFSRGFKRVHEVEIKFNNHPLEIVEDTKYLGIRLDRNLKWGKHIKEISEKCQKLINILKILAGAGWGVHPKHLRKLYISLVRSRIDYGSFLYDNSAVIHKYKLDKIQNQCLRIVGGFIKSTPIHTMESELAVPPLHLRRLYLAYKFCNKIRSFSNSGCVLALDRLTNVCSGRTYWSSKRKPILIEVFNNMRSEIIDCCDRLNMFTLSTWVSNIDIKSTVDISLKCVDKAKRLYEPNILKCDILMELNIKYNNWYKLFTDGSKSTHGIGASYYDSQNNKNRKIKIISKISIMSAELVAISEALSDVLSNRHDKIVIFSDSKSALQHVARCASGFRGVSIAYAILEKINELHKFGVNIKLQWIPSHLGLMGNEEADHAAKDAILIGEEISIKPDYSEIFSIYKIKCQNIWKEYFDERSKTKGIWYKIIQSEPLHIPWFLNDIGRASAITAARLRSGHIPCNKFAYLMKKVESPNCAVCNKVEDVYHLLLECARNDSKRQLMLDKCNFKIYDIGSVCSILAEPLSEPARMLYDLISK